MYHALYYIFFLSLIAVVNVYGEAEKDHGDLYSIGDLAEFNRKLADAQKRGGARAFGSLRSDVDGSLYSEMKRYNNLISPYYLYRQPKRGGGRAFASYYKPATNGNDGRYEAAQYFKKRTLLRDIYNDYAY